jgi:hypothetical protein
MIFFRPVIRAQLLKALSPILNFKSPKKPKPKPKSFNPSPKKSGPTHLLFESRPGIRYSENIAT